MASNDEPVSDVAYTEEVPDASEASVIEEDNSKGLGRTIKQPLLGVVEAHVARVDAEAARLDAMSEEELAYERDLIDGHLVWTGDLWTDWSLSMSDSHEVLGPWFAPELHPFNRSKRRLLLVGSLFVSMFVAAFTFAVTRCDEMKDGSPAELAYHDCLHDVHRQRVALAVGFGAIVTVYNFFMRFIGTCPCFQQSKTRTRAVATTVGSYTFFVFMLAPVVLFFGSIAILVGNRANAGTFFSAWAVSQFTSWGYSLMLASAIFWYKYRKRVEAGEQPPAYARARWPNAFKTSMSIATTV
eukprot:TRINITY_DN95256_c0_g1_i1.p1 TRINITY_DN95256_c0_g1~~TRINITY_DN95256_c0_g1_i1.p1  ORF type:complete len:298 (-),score=105.46 TRINITY_DN95256_c0_g1_i1:224-1117(-)